mgnify:CR=1 FL=1
MKKLKFCRLLTVLFVVLGVFAVLFGCLSPLIFLRDERQAASAAAYTAKGSFTFATRIASTPFECSVNFTSNNISFNKIEVRLTNSDYQIIYTHKPSSSSSDMSLLVYNDGWTSDAYRTIDFGDIAVDITERLYRLLDSGASEGEDGQLSNVDSYVVEGTWRVNSTPSLSGGSRSQALTNAYLISVDFSLEAITKIAVSSSGINYTINGTTTESVYASSWVNSKYRYIFFESPVTLSASFYNWFTSNSSQLSASILYNRLTIQTGNAESVSTSVNAGGETWGTISVTSNKQIYLPVLDGTLSLGFTVFSPEGYTLKSVTPTNATVSNLNGQLWIINLRLTYNQVSQIVINVQKESGGDTGGTDTPEDGTKVITPAWYKFNDTISLPDGSLFGDIVFIANGTQYDGMYLDASTIRYGSSGTMAYAPAWGGWLSGFTDARILIRDYSSVSSDFYTWFLDNLTVLNSYDSYLDGYNAGYDAGYSDGNNAGYNQGYSVGLAAGQNVSWDNLNVVTLFLSPVNSFLATPLFGSFSIGTAFSVVLVVLLAAIFIKMFAGG